MKNTVGRVSKHLIGVKNFHWATARKRYAVCAWTVTKPVRATCVLRKKNGHIFLKKKKKTLLFYYNIFLRRPTIVGVQ